MVLRGGGRKEGERNEQAYANKVFDCPPMHDGYGARIASKFSEFAVAMRNKQCKLNQDSNRPDRQTSTPAHN